MRDATSEVLAAAVFAEQARAYWRDVAEAADLERSFLLLEGEADAAQKRAEGERWAAVIGAATETDMSGAGRLWQILLCSCGREHRERAAAILCGRLRRARLGETA